MICPSREFEKRTNLGFDGLEFWKSKHYEYYPDGEARKELNIEDRLIKQADQ